MAKDADAFRTIGELSNQLGVAQHILRYWETRFPQLQPLTRAGNRRYYRPDDVALVERIHGLLSKDGYTIRGVQKVLASKTPKPTEPVEAATASGVASANAALSVPHDLLEQMKTMRDTLAEALAD